MGGNGTGSDFGAGAAHDGVRVQFECARLLALSLLRQSL